MKTKQKNFYTTSGVLVIFALLIAYLITTKNYPIAIVARTNPISAKTLDQAYSMALKLEPVATKNQVLNQLIKVREESLLVSASNQNIEDENNFLTSNAKPNEDKFTFEEFIVKPQVYDYLLRIKYNSDFKLNTQAYSKAQDIINQLNSGKSFDELAKTNSDDQVSGQLGGDLGFVKEGQILPELMHAIKNSEEGQINKQIILTRLGYDIIYPIETSEKDGEKYWHVKHILIGTEGYESWLSAQLKDFKVWHLIRI